MPWVPADGERRKSYCPECKDHRGTPLGVSFGPGFKTIEYRCSKCGHEWASRESAPRIMFFEGEPEG